MPRIVTFYSSLLLCTALTLMTACGGGGGSHAMSAVAPPPEQPAAKIVGHAAIGAPLSFARLMVIDKNGRNMKLIADIDGSFTFPVASFSAPLSIVADDPLGIAESQIAVLVDLPVAGASMVANVTPLTTAIAAGLSTSGNPYELASPAALVVLQRGDAERVQAFLRLVLANLLSDAGVAADVDFIAAPIVPGSHRGLDRVLDDLRVTAIGPGVRIVNLRRPAVDESGDELPGETIVLNRGTVAAVPPAPFGVIISSADIDLLQNSLATVAERLQACVVQQPATRLQGSICRLLVVPDFLDSGYGFEEVFDEFLGGATFEVSRVPNRLHFLSKDEAVIELLVGTTADNVRRLVVIARRNSVVNTQPNSWEITGDQSPYNAGLIGYLHKTTRLGDALPAVSYQSSIGFYYTSALPNPVDVVTVKITGPGLPSVGLVLAANPDNPGNFFIASKTGQLLTWTPGVGQQFYLDGTQENSTATLDPWPELNTWSDEPMSEALAKTLAGTPAYTFTLYDSSHLEVASFTRRLAAGLERAVNGVAYLWSELDDSTYAALHPPAAAVSLLPIGWKRPASGPLVKYVMATGSGAGVAVMGIGAGSSDATTLSVTALNGLDELSEFPALSNDSAYRSVSIYYRSAQAIEHISEWYYGSPLSVAQIIVNPFVGQGSSAGSTLTAAVSPLCSDPTLMFPCIEY